MTHAAGDVSEIQWSPDGRRIAFVRFYEGQSYSGPAPSEIYVIGAAGTGLRRLTGRLLDIQALRWSPDGRLLAFQERRRGVYGLSLVDVAGGKPRRLAESLLVSTGPSWSPDGRYLAVSAFTGGVATPTSAIYVVSTTGRRPRRVTGGGDATLPAWSPDGRWILYQQTRCSAGSCSSGLHVIGAEGNADRRLTHGASPTWAPDGRTIAFARRGKNNLDIWTMAADGSRQRRVASNTYGPPPAWSPDSSRIAFVRNNAVFVMNADGTRQRRVAADATTPAWRPTR